MSAASIRPAIQRTPTERALGWLRANLFSTTGNTLTTVLVAALIAWPVWLRVVLETLTRSG